MALRDVIGQDRAVRILLKTIERGRIPSSYLFAGEPGVGKRLTATNLAKALNCIGDRAHDDEAISYDCCDACDSCKKIDSNTHPDYRFIAPENGQIRIEEIREIDEVLSLKAFEGRYKVIMVDDAETMNQFAANAFLKILEEPPGDSLILLISSNPERLPDTIRSRCSRVNFMPLPLNACGEVIRRALAEGTKERDGESKESVGTSTEESHLETLERLSMGKPGTAITDDLIAQRTRFLALLKDMSHASKDNWASREEMEKWFDFALLLLRDMTVFKILPDEDQLINRDMKEFIGRLGNAMNIQGIIGLYYRLNTLKKQCYFNLNKSLTWNFAGSLLRKDIGEPYA
jgi:DNA polymerase-3 subunit delta'